MGTKTRHMELVTAAAIVALLAGAGCSRAKPAFDCDRPGASCGSAAGAVCVDDRCAVPSAECPSGLEYAGSAGDLAGTCVTDGAPDGGSVNCNNGVIDPGEACDGAQLGDATCASAGTFIGGTLACSASCGGFDTSGCAGPPTVPAPRKPMSGTYLGSHFASGTRRTSFEWDPSSVALDGVTITYDLEYGQDPNFGQSVTSVPSLTSPSYAMTADFPGLNLGSAPFGGRYFWRVRACVGAVCSDYSTAFVVHAARAEGDVNGDGYGDFVLGVPGLNEGSALGGFRLYFGGPAGSVNNVADLTVNGTQISYLGVSSAVGDMNGDGFADIVAVGIQTNPTALFYAGGPSPSTTPTVGFSTPELTADSASMGDLNGDGCADLVLGDGDYQKVYVYLGNQGDLDTLPSQTLSVPGYGADILSNQVAVIGDVNGDGRADLVAGLPTNGASGAANIYLGTASGVAPTPATTILGDGTNLRFGATVAAIGDVDRDGRADFAVAANSFNGAPVVGRAYVFLGAVGGAQAAPSLTVSAAAGGDFFGSSACGGDINRDGFADVVFGAYRSDAGGADAGSAVAYFANPLDTTSNGTISGATANDFIGFDCLVRDVTGDGFADVILGGVSLSAITARLYLGAAGASLSTTLSQTFSVADTVGGSFDIRAVSVR